MLSFLTELQEGESVMMEPGIWTALPQDLLLSILRRLPLSSFLRFRAVCKPWNTLLTNPSCSSYFLSSPPTFYNKPMAIFRTQQASSDSLLTPWRSILPHSDDEEDEDEDGGLMRLRWHRIELNFLLPNGSFISSHAGLVLVRRSDMQYLVCNPVLRVSRLLPRAPTRNVIPPQPILAIAAIFSQMNSFKVISAQCLGSLEKPVPTFLYDSDSGEWKSLGPFPFLKDFIIGNNGIGTICKNICYWSTAHLDLYLDLLAFDFEQETWQIFRTKRDPEPFHPMNYILWEWQDQLMMIAHEFIHLTFWRLLEDNSWFQFDLLTQDTYLNILLGFLPFNCISMGSMLLFVNTRKNKVLAFEIASKVLAISNVSSLVCHTFISFHPNLDAPWY